MEIVKRSGIFLAALILVLISVYPALAGTWGPIKTWNIPNDSTWGSYSPYKGEGQLYSYTGTDGKKRMSPKARNMYFTQSAIDSIRKYLKDKGYYYTFDISVSDQYNTTLSAYNSWWSNFPMPRYDNDDDPEPFGNGYCDETEVTCQDPSALSTSIAYRFESYFYDYPKSGTYAYLKYSSQMSYWFLIEYETALYTPAYITLRYPW